MSTYRQILYQIVFSTKNRIPSLEIEHQEELYKYIWGNFQNLIYGKKDMVHLRIHGEIKIQ